MEGQHRGMAVTSMEEKQVREFILYLFPMQQEKKKAGKILFIK